MPPRPTKVKKNKTLMTRTELGLPVATRYYSIEFTPHFGDVVFHI